MKILHTLLLLSLLSSSAAHARENPYDTLAKLLIPFSQLLAKDSKGVNRAVTMTARLETMTDLPPELAGARAELSLEYPDKLRLHAPILGEELTVVRDGQQLWVEPGEKAAMLLKLAETTKTLPPLDRKYRLEPFQLPIPEKQLVFAAALFQARTAGEESLDGALCHVIDVNLMPELARALDATGWAARIWVKQDGTLARITVAREKWMAAVRFEKVEFRRFLPAETWQPAADALELSPPRYKQLLDAFTGTGSAKKKERKRDKAQEKTE